MNDDTTRIPEHWTFQDRNIADTFDDHVREQLPWYDLVTEAIAHMARNYLPEHGLIYDIGASTGRLGRLLADDLDARKARLIAIEQAQEMADRYDAPGELVIDDVRNITFAPYDVAICNLVLMFLPPIDRTTLLDHLAETAKPGAAVIIVDKTEHHPGYLGTVLSRWTLAAKLTQGAQPTDVLAKELSLTGIQRPLTPNEAPGTLWFRFGDFAGWLWEPNPPTNKHTSP